MCEIAVQLGQQIISKWNSPAPEWILRCLLRDHAERIDSANRNRQFGTDAAVWLRAGKGDLQRAGVVAQGPQPLRREANEKGLTVLHSISGAADSQKEVLFVLQRLYSPPAGGDLEQSHRTRIRGDWADARGSQ